MRKYMAFLPPISAKAMRTGALLLELQYCEARMGLRFPWQARSLPKRNMHALCNLAPDSASYMLSVAFRHAYMQPTLQKSCRCQYHEHACS
jgi:hypothetical protein